MDRKAAGLERNSRTVGGVLCRPHAGLTGCNRNVKSRDERRLTPPPLTSPRSAVIFAEKAAAACAAPALKYFCSILHHNLAFTQNLGLTLTEVTPLLESTRFSTFFDFTVLRPLGISERGVFVSERTLRYYAFMYVNHKMLIKSMFFFHRQKSAKALPSFLQGLTNLHRSHFHQLHLPLPLVYSSWILVFWVAASLIPLR